LKATTQTPTSSCGTRLAKAERSPQAACCPSYRLCSPPTRGNDTRRADSVWAEPARQRRILLKTIVRAIGVAVTGIVLDKTAHVSLVEDEYVIQKISATASDPTLSHSILPRAYGGCVWSHAAGGKQIGCLLNKLAVTIQNRVPVRASLPNTARLQTTLQYLTWIPILRT